VNHDPSPKAAIPAQQYHHAHEKPQGISMHTEHQLNQLPTTDRNKLTIIPVGKRSGRASFTASATTSSPIELLIDHLPAIL
jgi:hypothetical protein